MNEFVFDVGSMMNRVTSLMIECGKLQNMKKVKEKQLLLMKQSKQLSHMQHVIVGNFEEEKKDEHENMCSIKEVEIN